MRVASSAPSPSSHTCPPHSHNNNYQQQSQLTTKKSSSSSSSLLRIIGVAIAFVLAFHWYLILHHVSYHAPKREHNPFLALSLGGDSDHGKVRGSRRVRGRRKHNNNGKEEPYILSSACGGCYRTYYKDGKYCHDLIQEYMQQNNGTSIQDASKFVVQDVDECKICNPDTCYNNQYDMSSLSSQQQQLQQKYKTKYWRFDQTAPQLNSPTSLVLPSIPDELRIPQSQYTNDNIESYIRKKYANPDPANITNVFLMEYNPAIAPIPTAMKEYLPNDAVYVLSLRVTPHNFCFGIWLTQSLSDDIKQTMHSLNHLGLALLDERYQIIDGGYNVVIDIDRQLGAKREHVMTEPAFVDFRLFTLNDELYLHINSDTVILTRLRLRSKTIMKEKGMIIEDDTDDSGTIQDFERDKKPFKLKNLYGGDTFEVTLLHQFNTIWGEGKESIHGKNYALYSIPNTTHPSEPDSIYAEMSVYPEHKVMQILPDSYDKLPKDHRIKWRQRRNFKVDHIIQRQMKSVGNATVSDRSKNPLIPSFFNVDEHWFPGGKNPFKEFAHGGACCVTLSLEGLTVQQQEAAKKSLHRFDSEGVGSLLVGVGHTLVKVRIACEARDSYLYAL